MRPSTLLDCPSNAHGFLNKTLVSLWRERLRQSSVEPSVERSVEPLRTLPPGLFTKQLGRLAEAGVQRVMLQWLDLDGLEALARGVLPI